MRCVVGRKQIGLYRWRCGLILGVYIVQVECATATTYLQTRKCAQIGAVLDADVGIATVGRAVRVFGGLGYAGRHIVGRLIMLLLGYS